MKIQVPQDLSNVASWEDLRRYASQTLNQIVAAINGNLGFGDNIKTAAVTATFTAAGAEVGTDHSLGRVPAGYLISGRSAAITVYDGKTDNTDKKIYLRASGAGTAKLLVY